ncbi:hypothetical protein JIN77_04585 [Verrucomicrobiaceae bacterium R5-34]|nr:hypothetical protein [Verrucomicrobiaceae bacterium R5-34]
MRITLLAITLLSGCLHAAPTVFLEKKGLVVIEAESTTSRLGKWVKKSSVKGFTGDAHLEFTSNKPETGPPKSPLKYTFKVSKGGKYSFSIRAHKRLISDRQDICNDCYVRLEGDFESGNKTPLKLLKKDTKMFGGKSEGWGYTAKLDDKHQKHTPVYQLKAGETYTLVVSGRSQNFNIDRFVFAHEDSSMKAAQKKLPKESRTGS